MPRQFLPQLSYVRADTVRTQDFTNGDHQGFHGADKAPAEIVPLGKRFRQ